MRKSTVVGFLPRYGVEHIEKALYINYNQMLFYLQGFITVTLRRENANQPWGFRLQGGKDRGLPLQLLKVFYCAIFFGHAAKAQKSIKLDNTKKVIGTYHAGDQTYIHYSWDNVIKINRNKLFCSSFFHKPRTSAAQKMREIFWGVHHRRRTHKITKASFR
jgi:hypothetical protein